MTAVTLVEKKGWTKERKRAVDFGLQVGELCG